MGVGYARLHPTISIHALRKESDVPSFHTHTKNIVFQSTLSVRRATLPFWVNGIALLISIHALRKESDGATPPIPQGRSHFNPRSP